MRIFFLKMAILEAWKEVKKKENNEDKQIAPGPDYDFKSSKVRQFCHLIAFEMHFFKDECPCGRHFLVQHLSKWQKRLQLKYIFKYREMLRVPVVYNFLGENRKV